MEQRPLLAEEPFLFFAASFVDFDSFFVIVFFTGVRFATGFFRPLTFFGGLCSAAAISSGRLFGSDKGDEVEEEADVDEDAVTEEVGELSSGALS